VAKKLDPSVAEKVMLEAKLKPLVPFENVRSKWKSRCLNCDAIVFPRYNQIKKGVGGCVKCGRIKQSKSSRLKEDLVMEIMNKANLQPLEPYKNASSKWKCKCLTCGKVTNTYFMNIQRGGGGCVPCGRKKSSLKHKTPEDLAVEVMMKAGLKPLEPYKNNSTRWKCLHEECGKVVKVLYGSVKRGQGVCPVCLKKKGSPIKTKQEVAEAVMLKAGFQPLVPYKHANAKWKCKHLKCNRITYPRYADVKRPDDKKTIGCSYCALLENAKNNRLPEDKVVKIMLEAKLKPLVPYVNANKRWKCECLRCGNIVFPRFGVVQRRNGGGCSTCAVRGITLTEPAYFYVIKHDRMGALKVGIGNPSSIPDRIQSYLKKDWILLKKYDFSTGVKAELLETKILKWIRKDLGLRPYLTRDLLKNGHTETADLNEIDLSILYDVIDKQIKNGLRK
jgi:hypothetical protein